MASRSRSAGRRFSLALGIAAPAPPSHDGPVVGVALAGRFLGWILLADEPRPEAASASAELKALGLAAPALAHRRS